MKQQNLFSSMIILVLAMLFMLFFGISIENNRHYKQELYDLRQELNETEDMYQKALYHIKMLNDERLVELNDNP